MHTFVIQGFLSCWRTWPLKKFNLRSYFPKRSHRKQNPPFFFDVWLKMRRKKLNLKFAITIKASKAIQKLIWIFIKTSVKYQNAEKMRITAFNLSRKWKDRLWINLFSDNRRLTGVPVLSITDQGGGALQLGARGAPA